MKVLKYVCLMILSFLTFGAVVDARVYTNEDVEEHLEATLANVNYYFKENIYIQVNRGTVTFKRTNSDATTFTTVFMYNDGKYTFQSNLSNIVSISDHTQNYYNFLAATTMASAILGIYDEQTALDVAEVEVSQELDDDHLTEASHGITWIDHPIEPLQFQTENGISVYLTGALDRIQIDLNNEKFQRLATTMEGDGQNPLEQILTIIHEGDRSPYDEDEDDDDDDDDDDNNDDDDDNDDPSGGGSGTGSGSGSGTPSRPGKDDDDNPGSTPGSTPSTPSNPGDTPGSTGGTGTGSGGTGGTSTDIPGGGSSYESGNPGGSGGTGGEQGVGGGTVENPKTGIVSTAILLVFVPLCIYGVVYLNKNGAFKNF